MAFGFQRVFGLSVKKKERDDKIKNLFKENEDLREQNMKLTFEMNKLKKDLGKVCRLLFDYLFVNVCLWGLYKKLLRI